MNRFLKPIVLLAASSFIFACNKVEIAIDENQSTDEFTYTFGFANGDASTLDTKATFASDETGMYIDFEDGDNINAYAYSTTTKKYSYNKQGAINYDKDPVTFQVISHYALVAGDEVYCHFPYSNSGTSPKEVSLSIKPAQTQKADKYDAKAAPMVSAPFAVKEDFEAKEEKTVGNIKFFNLASVIELDIFSPTGAYASENIQSISFAASDAISGNFTFDLTGVKTSDESTLSISGYTGRAVDLTFSESLNVGTATKKDNAKKAYIVVAPGTHSGTLTVVTDVAKYIYEVPSREFKRAQVRQFGINLEKEGARKVSSNVEFTLVESDSNIQSGATYLIVSYTASKYWAMSSFNAGNYYVSYEVSPSSKKFTVSDDKVVTVTLEDAGDDTYYLKDSDGQYIKGVSDNKLERASSVDGDVFKWKVSKSSITNASLTTRQIQLNASTNPKRFAGYTGSQTAITLYVNTSTLKQPLETPTVIASASGNSVIAEWINDDNAGSYIVTLSNGETETVTTTTKTFSGLSDGTYTVSVIAVAKDSKKYYNSQAGVSNAVIVGTPTLIAPTITAFEQMATGFSAKWTAGDEYAESYSWDLYEGSVDEENIVGTGTTTSTSISIPFTSEDMDINSFKEGTKYYLVLKATASGYADSPTDSKSFTATAGIAKGATWQSELLSYSTHVTDKAINLGSETDKLSWILNSTGTSNKLGSDKDKGLQIMGGGEVTATTTAYKGGVESITLALSKTKSGPTTLSTLTITVDGKEFKKDSYSIGTSPAEVVFTCSEGVVNATDKTISLKLGSSQNSVYVKYIKIN